MSGNQPSRAVIVTALNGRGLEHDANLLAPILRGYGYQTSIADYFNFRPAALAGADVAIWMENIKPEMLGISKADILIPNQEYFLPKWDAALPKLRAVWCKTIYAFELFRDMGANAFYTGFTSYDLYYPGSIPRPKPIHGQLGAKEGEPISFAHFRGQSLTKGTVYAMQAWASKPSLPPLDIYYSRPLTEAEAAFTNTPNIRFFGPQSLSGEEMRAKLNSYTAVVCPSPFEGFGHYINEAMGCGCIVIATEGEPMGEHIRHGIDGLLAGIAKRIPVGSGLGEAFIPLPESIVYQAERVLRMKPSERGLMQREARQSFLYRDGCFIKAVGAALADSGLRLNQNQAT